MTLADTVNTSLGDRITNIGFFEFTGKFPTTGSVDPNTSFPEIGVTNQLDANALWHHIGLGQRKGHNLDPEILTIGWQGLPASGNGTTIPAKNWLRFDVVRHFEGIPLQKNKEIIGVQKPEPSADTLKITREIVLNTDAGA